MFPFYHNDMKKYVVLFAGKHEKFITYTENETALYP